MYSCHLWRMHYDSLLSTMRKLMQDCRFTERIASMCLPRNQSYRTFFTSYISKLQIWELVNFDMNNCYFMLGKFTIIKQSKGLSIGGQMSSALAIMQNTKCFRKYSPKWSWTAHNWWTQNFRWWPNFCCHKFVLSRHWVCSAGYFSLYCKIWEFHGVFA